MDAGGDPGTPCFLHLLQLTVAETVDFSYRCQVGPFLWNVRLPLLCCTPRVALVNTDSRFSPGCALLAAAGGATAAHRNLLAHRGGTPGAQEADGGMS